jgi:hypothetical protein
MVVVGVFIIVYNILTCWLLVMGYGVLRPGPHSRCFRLAWLQLYLSLIEKQDLVQLLCRMTGEQQIGSGVASVAV